MPQPTAQFRFLRTAQYAPGSIIAQWTASTRKIDPAVESQIESAWQSAKRRLGDRLFDGPMCRLERFESSPGKLTLHVSKTSYRIFVGTNSTQSNLPPQVMANPIGTSCLVQTADDFLLLGHRNNNVAYYPNRIHPFAGTMDAETNLNVFAEATRELGEELSLPAQEVSSIICHGIVEDLTLRQPELIFIAKTTRTRDQVESTLDPAEHTSTFAIPATAEEVQSAFTDERLTPVAAAALLLWSKSR